MKSLFEEKSDAKIKVSTEFKVSELFDFLNGLEAVKARYSDIIINERLPAGFLCNERKLDAEGVALYVKRQAENDEKIKKLEALIRKARRDSAKGKEKV